MSKVYLVPCENYDNSEKAMTKLIAYFDELKNLKNKKVVIKVNLVSALSPEKAATTNPELLITLTNNLIKNNNEVIIGDSPGGTYTKEHLNYVYKVTKMTQIGAILNNNLKTQKAYFKNALILKNFEYTKYLDDADYKINFTKLKSHAMMGMTASVKNLFGTIPGTIKSQYHYRFPNHDDFANMLIDLNEYFKFDLNIIDSVIAMEGNGPTNGSPRKIGLILASKNPYELDYICAKIINADITKINTIKNSIKRNLLIPNEVETNIEYKKYIVNDFNIPKNTESLIFYENTNNIFKKIIQKIAYKLFSNKPYCNKSKCIGCKKCSNICPKKAISIINNKPIINRNKCIKCYCCQEFCPVGAMQVKKSIFIKIIEKLKRN